MVNQLNIRCVIRCMWPLDQILLMCGIYSSLKRALNVNAVAQTCHGLAQLLKSVK